MLPNFAPVPLNVDLLVFLGSLWIPRFLVFCHCPNKTRWFSEYSSSLVFQVWILRPFFVNPILIPSGKFSGEICWRGPYNPADFSGRHRFLIMAKKFGRVKILRASLGTWRSIYLYIDEQSGVRKACIKHKICHRQTHAAFVSSQERQIAISGRPTDSKANQKKNSAQESER